ncbi:VOC family protein [Singulisphaera sp. PoT]|uniref:VOC family protein n=1 Tax=Singulisphaera sp. PoT TaxID=3411797 RepID=UPI003BF59C47
MSSPTFDGRPNIFPAICYKDAPAIIDWLVSVFGFEKQFVVPGPVGTIAHAQLKFGAGVIMLGSSKPGEIGLKSPSETGGVTQTLYIYIHNIDSYYEMVRDAGAEILIGLRDTDYGSREFGVKDPEGQVWYFGTYYPAGPVSQA